MPPAYRPGAQNLSSKILGFIGIIGGRVATRLFIGGIFGICMAIRATYQHMSDDRVELPTYHDHKCIECTEPEKVARKRSHRK